MADLRDISGKNRKFKGAAGITVSAEGLGSGDRVNEKGRLRFNDTTDLLEYYTGTEWKSIDAPPTITNFSVDGRTASSSQYIESSASGSFDVVITGSLYSNGATVIFEGTGGGNVTADTVVVNSSSQITATFNDATNFNAANEPWTLKVTNPSGLFAQLEDCLVSDSAPVFTNAADTNVNIFDAARASGSFTAANLVEATDPDGDTITYSVSVGSLPSGVTLNASTGAISWSGVSAVGTDTISTFTITAATSAQSVSRQFKITVKAPFSESFTSTGAGTFTVPTGVTSLSLLVVGAGGSSGPGNGKGGAGAGGLVYIPSFSVTPGASIPYSVGNYSPNANGQNTTFSTITALGGGRSGDGNAPGTAGGSTGGTGRDGHGYTPPAGQQPSQPGDSGTYGFGNAGGTSPGTGWAAAGGGGGAGGAGGNGSGNGGGPEGGNGGPGGIGRAYSIGDGSTPVYYAGGGGGAINENPPQPGTGGQGGGGRGGSGPQAQTGIPGQANTGGGAGGNSGALGGTGIIIVRY